MPRRRKVLVYEDVVAALARNRFGVLSTVDATGRPRSAGVVFALSPSGADLYVMTRRHLVKARNIAERPWVAVTVPLARRLLWFVPPPCIQFQATAEVLAASDPEAVRAFQRFTLGRRILAGYRDLARRGDDRACFLQVHPVGEIQTYMLGRSLLDVVRRMEAGGSRVRVPEPEVVGR